MRVLVAVILIPLAVAFDAVLFSNEQKISSDYPSVENLLSTATADSPVVFFVNPDFTLGQFSQHVNAYSDDKSTIAGLAASVKETKYNGARFLDSGVHAPGAVEVTTADNFKSGSAVYIVAGEDWNSLDSLTQKILPNLGTKFTGIIVSTEAVSQDHTRVKRVTVRGMGEESAPLKGADFPLVIPPYNISAGVSYNPAILGTCLLYSEGINIVVYNANAKGNRLYAAASIRAANASWDWMDNDVKCENSTVGNYTFTLRINIKDPITGYIDTTEAFTIPPGPISFTLTITGDQLGWWQLTSASANSDFKVNKNGDFLDKDSINMKQGGTVKNVDYIGMNSVQGWAWGCYSSQALFFPVEGDDGNQPKYLIGVALYNTELQPFGAVTANSTKFTLNMDDCTGTFSTGSWMGIISAIVLLMGLLFGYLMLQAVKTMDRFDDPKQKQILINVRE